MNIEPAGNLRKQFLESLQQGQKPREGLIHVSELTLCLREAYYRRTQPKPPTEKQLGFFIDGARRHVALETLSGLQHEVKFEKYGVVGTLDMWNGAPVEFKSTRVREGVSPHYLDQVAFYCVLSGSSEAYLIIQRLIGVENPWEFYHITLSSEEVEAYTQQLQTRSRMLQQALANGGGELPKAFHPWKCGNCEYIDLCQAK